MGFVTWLVVGFIVGAIAKALVKGESNLGCGGTIGLGLIGSLVGGTLLNLLSGNGLDLTSSGFIGSVLGAVVVLLGAKKLGPKQLGRSK